MLANQQVNNTQKNTPVHSLQLIPPHSTLLFLLLLSFNFFVQGPTIENRPKNAQKRRFFDFFMFIGIIYRRKKFR